MALSTDVTDRLRAQWQATYDWVSGAVFTNPAQNTVLVDTGPLAAGAYLVHVTAWADAAALLDVQQRNAANGATVDAQRRAVPANSNDDFVFGSKIQLAADERLRVVLLTAGFAGTIQCAIFYVEVPHTA